LDAFHHFLQTKGLDYYRNVLLQIMTFHGFPGNKEALVQDFQDRLRMDFDQYLLIPDNRQGYSTWEIFFPTLLYMFRIQGRGGMSGGNCGDRFSLPHVL
jgi:hypothetical protein